jgi:molecular chaperone GrpE
MAKKRGKRGASRSKGKGKASGKDQPQPKEEETTGPKDASDKVAQEDLSKLKKAVEDIRAERDDLEDQLAYMQAEFENLKKRSAREVENRLFRAKEGLFLDLLDVMDNMERALQVTEGTDIGSFVKGVRMINVQLQQVLSNAGLSPIEVTGKEFDPFTHEAVEKVEDKDRPDGQIIEEVQKGFKLDDKVIRPSKVRVNVHPEDRGQEEKIEKVEEEEGCEDTDKDQ